MPHWTDLLDPAGPDGAYMPWKKVEPRVGISRTTAWRLQKTGDFPKPYVVSPGRVAYRESEIEAWKASRGHRTAEAIERRAPSASIRRTEAGEPPTWSPPAAARAQEQAELIRPRSPSPSSPGPSARAARRRPPKTSDGGQMTFEF